MRIPRSRVKIKLQEPLDIGAFPVGSAAKLDLAGLNLPASASVTIEACFRSSSMRFACGSVGSLAIPSSI